jgi:hypothetical protein
MHANEYMTNQEYNRYSNNPQDMQHYWHAFMLTDEYESVVDDWNMYCMGTQL